MSFPTSDVSLTHILVVSELSKSVEFYRDVLGANLFREYGGTSAVFDFNGSWLLLVTGGEPTKDKPAVTLAAPADPDRISHLMTFRVKDCRAAYAELKERGAEFLTEPVDWGQEIRCFFHDPDGHLLELSQA